MATKAQTSLHKKTADSSFLRALGHRLHSRRLGDLLLAGGLITAEQLDHALSIQRQTREPLGKILVRAGALSLIQLYRKLAEQWCLKIAAACLTMMMHVTAPTAARAEEPAIARVQLAVTAATTAQAGMSARAAQRAATIAPAAAPGLSATIAPARRAPGYTSGLFGSAEVRSNDISAFTKWTTVMARFEKQMGEKEYAAEMTPWKNDIAALRGKSARDQVAGVNAYINSVAYVEDKRNYHTTDYWATPIEFFAHGGDCEDFAIAKYASLRALGFRTDQLRIAIVQDKIKNIPHAILIVYTDEGSFVLDNQDKRARLTSDVTRYRPIFSINSNSWWLHKGAENA